MSDLLIDAVTLRNALPTPGLIVFDVRYDLSDVQQGRRVYADGHIPGARFLDQSDDLASQPTGRNGRHPLPDRHALAQLLQRWGAKPDSQIVVYDANNASFAARAWWLLRWLGYTDVRILDGGLQAWLDAGGELERGAHSVPAVPGRSPDATDAGPTTSGATSSESAPRADNLFEAGLDGLNAEPAMPTVSAEQILARSTARTRHLVDARTPERYRGEHEPIDPVAGRIDGALNRPIAQNVRDDGRFKSPELLRDEFTRLLGKVPGDEVVHYCGSGITACHNVFSMELAGLRGSALYPGSWSEWCSDPARPVAKG